MKLAGRKVAVLGAGGSGIAAATLALSHGASVAAFDSGDPAKLAPAVERFAEIGVTLCCGDEALKSRESFDITVISPGIATSWPIARAFDQVSTELIGEIELAFRMSETPVIAITGTNGKTTTTCLVTEMLNAAGKRAVAAGNIGLAYSEVVASGKQYDWIVLELSSFQLETIKSFSPDIAVWMNFAPDHMDRYEVLEDYRNAKLRLFENTDRTQLAICKLEDQVALDLNRVSFSAFSEGGDFTFSGGEITGGAGGERFDFSAAELQGKHNAENVMVALAVADQLGISRASIKGALGDFKAPAHRCEKIAELGGVIYLNDSKSTNLHSLESALAGQDSPIVLIVGGKNKGLDFGSLTNLVTEKVKAAICIGEIADEISGLWDDSISCECAASVSDAVSLAAKAATSGDIVLFSPGTSSFDMFSGYEARGEAFRGAVQALPRT